MGLLNYVWAYLVNNVGFWSFEFCYLLLVLQRPITLQLCDTEFFMANGVLVCCHTFGNLPPPYILFCSGGASINTFL